MKRESFSGVEALTRETYYRMQDTDPADSSKQHSSNSRESITVIEVPETPNWRVFAACANTDTAIFFPTDLVGVNAAKKICAECVVKEDCLEEAIINREDHGVWGGTSERERRKIVRSRVMRAANHKA